MPLKPVPHAAFATRHIGLTEADIKTMLAAVNSSRAHRLTDIFVFKVFVTCSTRLWSR